MIALALILALAVPAEAGVVDCPRKVSKRVSPCLPSSAERAMLLTELRAAYGKFESFEAATRLEADLRGRLLNDLNMGGRQATDWERGQIFDQWRAALDDIERNDAPMRREFGAVAKKIAGAYGVGPKGVRGRIIGGSLDGQDVQWAPRLQETRDYVYRAERFGVETTLVPIVDAETSALGSSMMEDGSVFISPRVFWEALSAYGNQGDLAPVVLSLARQSAKFDHLTCATWPCQSNPHVRANLSKERLEKLGLDAAVQVANAIGLDDANLKAIETERDSAAMRIRRALGGGAGLTPAFATDEGLAENRLKWGETQARLRRIRAQQESLRRRFLARSQGLPEEDLRDALSDLKSPPSSDNGCGSSGFWAGGVFIPPVPCPRVILPPSTPAARAPEIRPMPPPAPRVSPAFDPWAALADLAVRGCGAAVSVDRTEFETVWVKLLGTIEFYPDAATRLRLSGCPAELLMRLLPAAAEGKGLSWEEFGSAAEAARSAAAASREDIGQGGRSVTPPNPCAERGSFGGVPTGCR